MLADSFSLLCLSDATKVANSTPGEQEFKSARSGIAMSLIAVLCSISAASKSLSIRKNFLDRNGQRGNANGATNCSDKDDSTRTDT